MVPLPSLSSGCTPGRRSNQDQATILATKPRMVFLSWRIDALLSDKAAKNDAGEMERIDEVSSEGWRITRDRMIPGQMACMTVTGGTGARCLRPTRRWTPNWQSIRCCAAIEDQ